MLLTKNRLLLVSLETVKGTAVAATIPILAEDIDMASATEMQDRSYASKTAGQQEPDYPGDKLGKLTLKADALADGSGWNPGIAVLLQGCGLKDVTGYKPQTSIDNQKTLSFELYEGGRLKKMSGCMGELKMTWERGKIIKLEFDFDGVWGGVTDAAMPATALPTAFPINAGNPELDSSVALTASCNLTMNNVRAFRGGTHYVITSRSPELSLDPEAALVAEFDFYGKKDAATMTAVSMTATNGTGTITVTAPKAQINEIKGGDRDGIALDEVTLKCKDTADGDDAIVIVAA